jgi:hypothetical protein
MCLSQYHWSIQVAPLARALSGNSSIPLTVHYVLLWWHVRLNEHLAEVFQLLGATDFLGKERELDDVEEFIVKFMGFI